MWTRVRHLKRVTFSRSLGQPPSQSWLAAVKLHHPFVDTDAYVDSSDVSLAEYLCTHVFLIYVFAERLQSNQWFRMDFDVQLVTSATILYAWEGLVDSQASQPFSFVVVCTQTCYASVACMLCMLGHVTSVCNKCYDGSSRPLSI